MYKTLQPERLIETVGRLKARIEERFPGASLGRVCAELHETVTAVSVRAELARQPNPWLRGGILALVFLAAALLVWVMMVIDVKRDTDNLSGVLQGIEASMNILVLLGAAVFFLVTAEERLGRRRALKDLHELRSIVHVIDMHQLTKDPVSTRASGPATPSSPARDLSPFELMRYLDYCAEMLSLSAKAAALYGQSTRDAVVIGAVSDIEQLTSNLASKVWQKIMILQMGERPAAAAPAASPVAPEERGT
jgi:hypothetical protein